LIVAIIRELKLEDKTIIILGEVLSILVKRR